MELLVLNPRLEIIGIIDNYQCLMWNRELYQISNFTLEVIPEFLQFGLLKKGNFLIKKDNPKECMEIYHRQLEENDEGIEILVVSGFSPSHLYSKKITLVNEIKEGTSEDVMRAYVNDHCINPTNINRKVPRLSLEDSKGLGNIIKYPSHYKSLDEELETIASMSELGYRTNFNIGPRNFSFEVYQGLDRTVNQNINSHAIFSAEFENVSNLRYIDNDGDYKSTALVAGAGENESRKTLWIGDEISGWNRCELFVDARDISDTKNNDGSSEDIPIPKEEYDELLRTRGKEKLNEHQKIETFNCTLLNSGSLEYRKDFDLGDKVSIVNKKWNLILHERITSIEETYDQDGLTIEINIGNNIPSLLDKLKRRI
ncbi:siphovirus ReqiPepy6 Gp37-like family protein [Faecalimicrobium sp. JNUCC 81]